MSTLKMLILPMLAALAGHAGAQDVHVSSAGLDLATPKGTRAFDRRITAAVATVCLDPGATADPARRFAHTRCRRKKLAEVRAQRDRLVARAGAGQAVATR